MTRAADFWFACVGGLIAAFIAYGLPDLIQLAEDETYVLSWKRFFKRKAPVVLALTAIAGAFAAFAVHPLTAPGAFAAGLGVQAAIKGVSATFRDITPAQRRRK